MQLTTLICAVLVKWGQSFDNPFTVLKQGNYLCKNTTRGLIFWNLEIRLCLLVKKPSPIAADLDFSHLALVGACSQHYFNSRVFATILTDNETCTAEYVVFFPLQHRPIGVHR
jgi:hypothetical protein